MQTLYKSITFISLLLMGGFNADANQSCKNTTLSASSKFLIELKGLPSKSSKKYKQLVINTQLQLNQNKTYALIDLREFLTEVLGETWFNSLPKDISSQISNGGEILYQQNQKLVVDKPTESQIRGVENLKLWMQEFLIEVLGNQKDINSGFFNVRLARDDNNAVKFDEWHVDGGGASVTLSLYGKGTEILGPASFESQKLSYYAQRGDVWERICKGCKPTIVPAGVALVFFGNKSGVNGLWNPLVHRTPLEAGDRLLIVLRY